MNAFRPLGSFVLSLALVATAAGMVIAATSPAQAATPPCPLEAEMPASATPAGAAPTR